MEGGRRVDGSGSAGGSDVFLLWTWISSAQAGHVTSCLGSGAAAAVVTIVFWSLEDGRRERVYLAAFDSLNLFVFLNFCECFNTVVCCCVNYPNCCPSVLLPRISSLELYQDLVLFWTERWKALDSYLMRSAHSNFVFVVAINLSTTTSINTASSWVVYWFRVWTLRNRCSVKSTSSLNFNSVVEQLVPGASALISFGPMNHQLRCRNSR